MDGASLDKYLTKKKTRPPNSERSEQITRSMEITKKPYGQLCGLTRHLQPDQIFRLNKESKGAPELFWFLLKEKYMDRTKNKDYQLVKEKLEKVPAFRERQARDPFLSLLALRKIGIPATTTQTEYTLTLDQMADYAVKFGSYARMWRAVMEDCPELHGKDYMSKEQEEALVKSRLGYK